MDKLNFVTFDNLSQYPCLVHFQTYREGGLSIGDFSSLNMSYSGGDDPEAVLENRKLVAEGLGVPLEKFVFCHQTHSLNVRIVGRQDRGKGVYLGDSDELYGVDAMITNEVDTMLCVKTADCIPVICFDPVKRVIAALTAGWELTAGRMAVKTINLMHEEFGTLPSDIIVGIGVGAGVCCYEVNGDVLLKLQESLNRKSDFISCFNKKGSKFFVDLKQINRVQLEDIGVLKRNIEMSECCSICHSTEHFSFRASAGKTGRAAIGIMLKS